MTLEEAKKEILGMSMGAIGERGMNPLKEGISYDGLIRTYDDILAILAKVDTDPIKKDKMTLTELAHELRKIFRFKYLAYGEEFRWGQVHYQLLIGDEPFHLEVTDEGGEGCPCIIHEWFGDGLAYLFDATEYLVPNLDLSEYADENGTIDYSKCIVEVE